MWLMRLNKVSRGELHTPKPTLMLVSAYSPMLNDPLHYLWLLALSVDGMIAEQRNG